jgi:hypothetical protein
MKAPLYLIAASLLATTSVTATEPSDYACKGLGNCKSMGDDWWGRRIKNTNYCFNCVDNFSNLNKKIHCDGNVWSHGDVVRSVKEICSEPTNAPTGSPTPKPTPSPTNEPWLKQFSRACKDAAPNCGVPRYHKKKKAIDTRGAPICAPGNSKSTCKVLDSAKKLAKKLDKKKN